MGSLGSPEGFAMRLDKTSLCQSGEVSPAGFDDKSRHKMFIAANFSLGVSADSRFSSDIRFSSRSNCTRHAGVWQNGSQRTNCRDDRCRGKNTSITKTQIHRFGGIDCSCGFCIVNEARSYMIALDGLEYFAATGFSYAPFPILKGQNSICKQSNSCTQLTSINPRRI